MLRHSVSRLLSSPELLGSASNSFSQAQYGLTPLAHALLRRCWPQSRHFSSDGDQEAREITNPRVLELAEQVMHLNLLEISDLTEVLRKRLNIQAPAFSMPGMGLPMAAGLPQTSAPTADVTGAAAKEEQTEFTVKLEGYDAAAKIKVIKEVRGITDLGLKEAKELVESSPAVLKKGLKKEEAEILKAKLEAAGAKVALE